MSVSVSSGFFWLVDFLMKVPLLSGLCYVSCKTGKSNHNFHDTGKKLHSQNEQLIGRNAGDGIKAVLGVF